jgi:hypothetical protein
MAPRRRSIEVVINDSRSSISIVIVCISIGTILMNNIIAIENMNVF